MKKKPAVSSPLPWRLGLDNEGREQMIYASNGDIVCRVNYAPDDAGNRALIVRRVNEGPKKDAAFAAMKEAGSRLLGFMGCADTITGNAGLVRAEVDFRAALQQAQEADKE